MDFHDAQTGINSPNYIAASLEILLRLLCHILSTVAGRDDLDSKCGSAIHWGAVQIDFLYMFRGNKSHVRITHRVRGEPEVHFFKHNPQAFRLDKLHQFQCDALAYEIVPQCQRLLP